MTEIPEHLLARSKARRSAMGGGGDAGGGDEAASTSSAPATTESAAPAAAAAASPEPAAAAAPAAPEPVAPWVTAAQTRQKIPVWAVPVLAMLPLWGVVYALTLDPPTPDEAGAFVQGAEIWSGPCAGCHGGAGGGQGAIPGVVGENDPNETFANPAHQVAWIALGSSGLQAAGFDTYGPGTPIRGGMPGWMDTYSAEEIMSVVVHTRYTMNDGMFDAEEWEDGWEETLSEYLDPDMVAAFTEVLEEWVADPPSP